MGFTPEPVDPSASPWHLLGAAIRHWRDDVQKLSLGAVAAQTWTDPSNLSKWERGERLAPPDAIERLDLALGANGFLAALRAVVIDIDQTARVSVETDTGHADGMDLVRRQILAAIVALGGGAMLPVDGLEGLRNLVDGGADSVRLEDWEEIAYEYGHAFRARTLPELIADLALDVLALQRIMRSKTARGAPGWARVNAQMTFLLAHALGSAGQARESRDWWITARHAAEAYGDPRLVSFARAKAAVQGLYERRPFPLLLERADAAIAAAREKPCAGVAVALAVHAQVRAMQGDVVGARDALVQQGRVFEQLPEEVTGDTSSVFGWPEARMLHTRSYAASYGGGLSNRPCGARGAQRLPGDQPPGEDSDPPSHGAERSPDRRHPGRPGHGAGGDRRPARRAPDDIRPIQRGGGPGSGPRPVAGEGEAGGARLPGASGVAASPHPRSVSMTPVTFTKRTGASAAAAVLSDAYLDVYDEIHADPSYNDNPLFSRERFVQRTTAQSARPGFALVSAENATTLAGFCFGFTMAAGSWWGGKTDPPPGEVLDAPKLAVIELMVTTPYRGTGAGRQLLYELLGGREEPHATLLARPDAPAHAMYERWGWRVAGTCQPAPDGPVMDVMLIELVAG